jgi:TolA-binding protein
MDWGTTIPYVVSILSVAVAIATWLTSASKSQVEKLCAIVDAQADYILQLERRLKETRLVADGQETRIQALEGELQRAQEQLVVLDRENCHYRRILERARINVDSAEVNNGY